MGTTPSKIWYPESDDSTRLWELMRQQAESINTVVPVANVSERLAVAEVLEPTPARPLYVHRADAPMGRRLEWTEDGDAWMNPGLLDGIYSLPSAPEFWTVSANNPPTWHMAGDVVTLFGGWQLKSGNLPASGGFNIDGIPPVAYGARSIVWSGTGGGYLSGYMTMSGSSPRFEYTARAGTASPWVGLDGVTYRAAV